MLGLKYLLHLLIPAFLVTSKAKAQGQPRLTGDTILVDSSKSLRNTKTNCTAKQDIEGMKKIKGRLVDEQGKGIAAASIIIKDTKSGTIADANGNFIIDPFLIKSKAPLVFSCIGFCSKEMTIDTSKSNDISNIGMVQMASVTLGEVVIVGTVSPRKRKEPIKLIQRMLKDTVYKFFKAYPNPLLAGNLMKLELKKAEAGEYRIDLINLNGQVVHSSDIFFDLENQVNSFPIPFITPASNLLCMTNRKTGKQHTEKIIIQ